MAETKTATETDLQLTPPDPVPAVSAEKAAGLVPVSEDKKSKLEEKVDGFVDAGRYCHKLNLCGSGRNRKVSLPPRRHALP